MLEFIQNIFSQDFMPHGHCFFWKPDILWLFVVSDGMIAASYYSIPIAIIYFLRKRKDLMFKWIYFMFGLFIILCGTTHLMFIWTLWNPTYRLEGIIRLLTAIISVTTAAVIWPLIPKALAIPSPVQLRDINRKLIQEINERRRVEDELQETQLQLEVKVKERTANLAKTNQRLEEEITERKRTEEFFRRYDFIVNTSKDMSSLINKSYTYEAVNDALCHNICRDRQKIIGQKVADIWGEKVFKEFIKPNLDRCLVGEEINYQAWLDLPQLGRQYFSITYYPYHDNYGDVSHAVVISHNITERKNAEEALRKNNSFLRILQITAVSANEAVEIEDAFKPILNEVCRYTGWPIGHAYLLAKDNPHLLESTSIWHIENAERFAAFRDTTANTKFEKGKGLPGRVLDSGKPDWIVNVINDPNFTRAKIAKTVGIKSGFAFPVFTGTEVVSVLEFFSTEEKEPDHNFLKVMVDVGVQLGRIIERKKAEEALRESEKRYRTLFERSADAVLIIEGDSFVDCNSATVKMLGYENKKEVLNTHPSQLSPPLQPDGQGSFEKANQMIAMAFSRGSNRFEWDHQRKNGEVFPVEVLLTSIPFKEGNLLHVVWRDITERKQAESEMRRLKNLLKNIIDSMPSIIVGVDAEGKVTQWNQEAEKYTGITSEDANGQVLTSVFPQFTGKMEKIQQAIKDRVPIKEEKVPQKDNGETRYSDVTIYPLITNGVEGAVVRVDDVTERVRIEEMMIQSEKMLSVGGLAAGMAHEINNPLAGILQSIQVVLERTSAEIPANLEAARECGTSLSAIRAYMEKREIVSMTEAIRDSGHRAAKIVSNMLSFSRKDNQDFAQHDITELLDQTLELASNDYDLKKKYDFRTIKIERQYEADLPSVKCGKPKIQQVILNILRNGAQAMAEQTNSTEGPIFTIRALQEEDAVRIEIEDNGPGMNESVRKRVFEPFYSTKEVGAGTGLGLSVSYFIITENHGGSMTVESVPDNGTKFIIHLPLGAKL